MSIRATRKFADTDNTVSKQGRLRGLKPLRPGQSGNPAGRPKGSRNKLSEAFLRDFCALWEELGDEALRRMAAEDPSTFVRAAVALIPKHHELSGPEDGPHIVEVRWKDNEAQVAEQAAEAMDPPQ